MPLQIREAMEFVRRPHLRPSAGDHAPAATDGARVPTTWRISGSAALVGLAASILVFGTVVLGVAYQEPSLAYAGLFFTSLVAGSVLPFLPGSSELAMAGLLATETGRPAPIIGAAIVGTVLGASANYLVGRYIARFSDKRWFPLSPDTLAKARRWFRRYGVWILLLCWVPTAGDAMTVVAGLLRADLRLFLMLTATGKAFGHLAVASGVTWVA
jgi:membrane protein YqaA with SNARE-associated domain